MLAPISRGIENLLALATELERVHELYEHNNRHEGYCQRDVSHPCGTPSCAIGHYIGMRQSQGVGGRRNWSSNAEFGFENSEWVEVFGTAGCNNAQTALEAATYIRAFVARKIEAMSGVA